MALEQDKNHTGCLDAAATPVYGETTHQWGHKTKIGIFLKRKLLGGAERNCILVTGRPEKGTYT
jgi:hypothetical protein